jgi:hypothetical protein
MKVPKPVVSITWPLESQVQEDTIEKINASTRHCRGVAGSHCEDTQSAPRQNHGTRNVIGRDHLVDIPQAGVDELSVDSESHSIVRLKQMESN